MLTSYFLQPLATFDGANGAYPISTVVMNADGDLFGTTYSGSGAGSKGTIYEIAAGSGTITTLASFDGANGTYPWASLLMDANGNLFGNTLYGGTNDSGAIYELAAGAGTITLLASFNGGTDGGVPNGRLILDSSGNLFGTASTGGANGHGTIFELPAGSNTILTLASFAGGDGGSEPLGDLYADTNGNLFGTAHSGGDIADDPNSAGFGTIFELPAGSNTILTLATFNGANGAKPVGGLVADASGNLFGATSSGGDNGFGNIFELPLGTNTITPLASFNGTNGSAPYDTLIIDASGNLFGTTTGGGDHGCGVVFELPAGSNTLITLATFDGATNGSSSYASLVADANGHFFGTTTYGGDLAADTNYGNGYGLVFELIPIGPPAMLSFVQQPSFTSVGQPITPAITVYVQDANGHLVDTDTSTITIASPTGATINGTLSVAAIHGVATFSDLSLTAAGSYTLDATDGTLVPATSNSFTITNSLFVVRGNGTPIANGDATPTTSDFTDFGDVPLHTLNGNFTRTFTIQNLTNQQISLTGSPRVTVSGLNAADFTITTQPASTIAGGSSSTFTITFNPTVTGLETAHISIASSDLSQNPFTFDIQGSVLTTTDDPNGLQIAINHTGSGFATLNGQVLNVLYTGSLLDGTVFDASSRHGNIPLTLTLGAGQVIAGWEQGLLGMKVGEIRTLVIPSTLAYGTTGAGTIPPNATLIFQVQLLSASGPTLGLTGQGATIVNGDTTPSTADDTHFGDVAFGSSVSHTFSISNLATAGSLTLIGTQPVTISGPGADQFTVTQPALGTDQTGTFTITYHPTANETAIATITVASNDPNTPNFTFTIGGSAPANLSGVFASTLNVPTSLAVGAQFTIPLSLTNSGLDPAIGTLNLVAQASPNGTWNASNATLATLSNVSVNISPGSSKTLTFTATIPAATILPNGTYSLLVMIQPVTVLDNNTANDLISLKGGAAVPLNITPVGPNLQVAVGAPKTTLAAYVPGDKITIPVTISNTGNQPAIASSKSPLVILLRASTDGSYNTASPLLAQAKISSTIAAGKSTTLNVTFTLPATVPAGAITPVAFVDNNTVAEYNENDNTDAAANPLNILWQFGAVAGRKGSVPLTFNDADGTKVTLKISGPGTGTLTSNGTGFDISIANTTAASAFNITTTKTATPGDNGRFTLDNLTIGNPATPGDHTSIGTINAATTDLAGSITITGAASTLKWGNFAGPNTLSIGASPATPASSQSVNLTFGSVKNLQLTSAIGIGNLTATDWQNNDTSPDFITAPWLKSLKITGNKKLALAGDFAADLTLTEPGNSTSSPLLTTVSIANSITGGNWTIAGNVTTLTAKAIQSSWNGVFTGNISKMTLSNRAAISTLTLSANAIGTLSVAGGLANSSITLSQIVSPTTKALGTLTVTGDITNSQIRSRGNIGSVRARSLVNSLLFAGVLSSVDTLPASAADFADPLAANLPTISSVTFTGFPAASTTAAFTHSYVAGGTIKTVKFPSTKATLIDAAGTTANFGFATRLGTTTYTGPASSGFFISPTQSGIS